MYSKRGDNNVKSQLLQTKPVERTITSDKAFTEHGKWTNANVADVIWS